MANNYARHALSQRGAFEATHPAVLAAAGRLASEPGLRVADLGAADGVNSHGLIRDLVAQRAGRQLIYTLVDLPTNAWGIAAAHLRAALGPAADQGAMVVIPAPGEAGPGVADTGTGAHYAVPEAGAGKLVRVGTDPQRGGRRIRNDEGDKSAVMMWTNQQCILSAWSSSNARSHRRC